MANASTRPDWLVGLIFYAYPLHPPGDRSKLRDMPIIDAKCPMLFLCGTKDPFCDLGLLQQTFAKMNNTLPKLELIDGGDHSYKAKGGGMVYQANLTKVANISVAWAQKIFSQLSSSPIESSNKNENDDDDDDDDGDEVTILNPKKRKDGTDIKPTSTAKRPKAPLSK